MSIGMVKGFNSATGEGLVPPDGGVKAGKASPVALEGV